MGSDQDDFIDQAKYVCPQHKVNRIPPDTSVLHFRGQESFAFLPVFLTTYRV